MKGHPSLIVFVLESLLDCYMESVISLVSDVYRWEKHSFEHLFCFFDCNDEESVLSLLSLCIVLLLRSSLLVKRSL